MDENNNEVLWYGLDELNNSAKISRERTIKIYGISKYRKQALADEEFLRCLNLALREIDRSVKRGEFSCEVDMSCWDGYDVVNVMNELFYMGYNATKDNRTMFISW